MLEAPTARASNRQAMRRNLVRIGESSEVKRRQS
jgi:hypothetical protein